MSAAARLLNAALTVGPGGICPECPDDEDIDNERRRTYESYEPRPGDIS